MQFKNVAIQAAKKAGTIITHYYNTGLKKQLKGSKGRDFVTKADLESEKIIVKTIKKYFPKHNFLTEEVASENNNSEYTWVIDPLDGTTNFSRGLAIFSVSIALAKKNTIILGVVYNPINKELFVADTQGAYLNTNRIQVSSRSTLAESTICHSLDYSNEKRKVNLKNINKLFLKIESFRMFHSTALELCNVACARTDGYVISSSNPWDIAAGAYILEKAKGKVTELDGKPWNYMRSKIIATNGMIHKELLKLLK